MTENAETVINCFCFFNSLLLTNVNAKLIVTIVN